MAMSKVVKADMRQVTSAAITLAGYPSRSSSLLGANSSYFLRVRTPSYSFWFSFTLLARSGVYSVGAGFPRVAAGTDFNLCPSYHLWSYANDHGS